MFVKCQATVHQLTKLICILASTVQVVLIAQMNFRYLQQQRIKEFKEGNSVVDPKSPYFQWVLPNSAWKSFGSKNKCTQERLGWSLSGDSNWRRMGFTGPGTSYKRIASEERITSIASISQAVSDEAYLIQQLFLILWNWKLSRTV